MTPTATDTTTTDTTTPQDPSQPPAPPKIIDPKFRARRVAVKREEGRRRLRTLLFAVAAATILGGAFLLTLSSLLDVDRIDVIGSAHTPAPLVGQATHVRRGAPLIWTNRGDVARRVERLAWVEHAQVRLALPGRLRITITERVPAVVAARPDNSFAVLDRDARVLTIMNARPPGLPEILGSGVPPQPGITDLLARPALAVLRALSDDLRGRITAIDVNAGLTVKFNSGPEARLGSTDVLAAKVAALHAVLADLTAKNQPAGYIDVRVPNAPVVG